MNIPEEIVEALVEHYGADAVRSALDQMQAKAEAEKPVQSELRPLRYWDFISLMNERQEAKGRLKYGQPLEENTDMPNVQRIEHAQEEAIDLLKYLEHLKQTVVDGITANDYQRAAMRTASGMNYENHGMLLNGVLGLCGESGEVADQVKKSIFQGHILDVDHVAEELGDVAWYLAVTAHAIGYDLGDIFQMNIDKLAKRYPEGFSKERSINREG
ncbi:MAG: nucleoside triphosphate pyrophosphohydrolase family protein [Akkermansia sp.]|nr:nucleoside triphosphate pyrophosphohydrolase family protein [Akkermansia sp.]